MGLCRRCSVNEAVVDIRSDPLCRSCFAKYVNTKVVKRMDTVKIKFNLDSPQQTYLLPLSLGISSLSLLDILSTHISSQMQKSGRATYNLHVLHVDTSGYGSEYDAEPLMNAVKERFPSHTYTTIKLDEVMEGADTKDLIPATTDGTPQNLPSPEAMNNLLSSATSPTARTDMLTSLRTKLITSFAKKQSLDTILWGDTTTRLAEKTLASTAKGLGFALPWIAAEGPSHTGLKNQYPLREIFKKELELHANLAEPPLTPLLKKETAKAPVSAKNSTIDELMAQYFQGVEREYPGIVANVVRTTGKLRLPDVDDGTVMCRLCDVPITESVDDGSAKLCMNCSRALPQTG